MSRFLYRNLELLEPYEGKLSRTVLRGESSRKGADLPDQHYKTKPNVAALYDALWRQADQYAVENLKDEELSYYYDVTD